jgi:hypothetical protein
MSSRRTIGVPRRGSGVDRAKYRPRIAHNDQMKIKFLEDLPLAGPEAAERKLRCTRQTDIYRPAAWGSPVD